MSNDGMVKGAMAVIVLGSIAVLVAVVLFVTLVVAVISGEDPATRNGTCVASVEGVSGSVPEKWRADVEDAAAVSGLPVSVLAAQIDKESGWNETAVNESSGAAGMAQFMPDTWAAYGQGDPLDGSNAIKAMGRYMGELKDQASAAGLEGEDQVRGTLAAYNWGPGSMAGAGWDWTKGPSETTDYVTVILERAQVQFSEDCEAVTWDGDLGDGEWTHPLPNSKIMSGYGPRNIPGYPAWANNHAGVDFGTGRGNGTVIAPFDMRVTAKYPIDGCVLGKATGDGPAFGVELCHLDSDEVRVGQQLKRGDVIGEEGGTAGNLGGRTVEHLHFAMYDPSGPDPQFPGHQNPVIDPTPLLRAKGAL